MGCGSSGRRRLSRKKGSVNDATTPVRIRPPPPTCRRSSVWTERLAANLEVASSNLAADTSSLGPVWNIGRAHLLSIHFGCHYGIRKMRLQQGGSSAQPPYPHPLYTTTTSGCQL